MCPVLDFPETNLLDDLSLVRHQCPPKNLGMQNNPFLQKKPWVLQQVMGHKVEFNSEPFQSHQPVTECSQQEAPLMQREIELLLAKGAIIPITQAPAEQGFISTVFLDPKDGGARPVINLRALNYFISSQHFKMEGMHLLKDLIQSGNWVMRVDLKNAYFKVPIHPTHQRYLRFIWKRSFNSHASRSASVQPHEYSPNS